MDYEINSTLSQAHPETMDFLSRSWCNFAVQALQPNALEDRTMVLVDNPIKFDNEMIKSPTPKTEKSVKDDSLPPWKSNDLKSWIWMQQAMHPELNYNSGFRKKWLLWNMTPFKIVSIKKWLKEMKLKSKEAGRLQRAEVHAAISVAGVAAALAAIAAAENSKQNHDNTTITTTKEYALASAASLVAAQCAQVAESIGAKKEQLRSMIGSAISSTITASDILTLTAAASTSLRGAATLKARTSYKMRLNGSAPLSIEENNDNDFDFEKCRSILSKGVELNVETPNGKNTMSSVSISLNKEAKVILNIRKLNLLNAFASMKSNVVLDLHAELYKGEENEEIETETETANCYLIVLTTDCGTIKLDMVDDYLRYKTWTMTINHMLMLSTSFTRYELQFYKN